jgi:hypothetical protein
MGLPLVCSLELYVQEGVNICFVSSLCVINELETLLNIKGLLFFFSEFVALVA